MRIQELIYQLSEEQRKVVLHDEGPLLVVAGAGCLTGDTPVNGIPIAERTTEGSVNTLYGSSMATKSFLKGRADMYRVRTQSGRVVKAMVDHLFLTPIGWRRLRDLGVGEIIAADDTDSALSVKGTPKGSLVCCSSGLHPCDGLPGPVEVDAQDKWQRFHKTVFDNSALLGFSRLSIGSYPSLTNEEAETDVSLPQQLSIGLGYIYSLRHNQYQDLLESLRSGIGSLSLPVEEIFWGGIDRHQDHDDEVLHLQLTAAFPTFLQSLFGSYTLSKYESPSLRRSVEQTDHSGGYVEVSYSNNTHFWDEIVEITFISNGEYYDITVPTEGHYLAEGLWHHNSGKTRALTYRTAALVEKGTPPESIIVSTFTNRATREFRDRLELLLGDRASRLNLGTLHSTGAKILRSYGDLVGYNPAFTIYDSRDSVTLMKKVAAELSISKDLITARDLLDGVSRYKEKLLSPCDALIEAKGKHDLDQLLAKAYDRYQEKLVEEGAMDFGDLVSNTVHLLQQYPGIRERIGAEHLLVDEFQDTDYAQFTMVRLLLSPAQNITAVGDIDQAIYSFRGADHTIMCNFQNYFPNAVIQSLGKNYRCSRTIVEASASVIRHNKNRITHNLVTDNPVGEPVIFITALDEIDESVKVSQQIVDAQNRLQIPLSQIAILYRTNIQSLQLEEQLLKSRIPYHVVGSRFFERKEIVDVLTYLRMVDNIEDSTAVEDFLNNPKKKLSAKSRAALESASKTEGKSLYSLMGDPSVVAATPKEKKKMLVLHHMLTQLVDKASKETLPELVKWLLIDFGIKSYYLDKESKESQARGTSAVDNLSRLYTMISNQYEGIAKEEIPELLHHADLMSDETADSTDGVQLMTLHAAKGTEYQVVFLVGAEENIIPHWRALRDIMNSTNAVEEERRLFYVGMTRAKKLLYIIHARNRKLRDREIVCYPSRFLKEIPTILTVNGASCGWTNR